MGAAKRASMYSVESFTQSELEMVRSRSAGVLSMIDSSTSLLSAGHSPRLNELRRTWPRTPLFSVPSLTTMPLNESVLRRIV